MASRIPILILIFSAAVVSQETMFQPRFTDGNQLIRPEGYREWMFAGSNLNMGYTDGAAPGESRFHNIYIQREAYRQFAATGKFPDKTTLVMEVLASGTNASINKTGQFEDKPIGIEVTVKDERRSPRSGRTSISSGAVGRLWRRPRRFPKRLAGTATTSTARPTTCSYSSIPSYERRSPSPDLASRVRL